MRPSNGSGIPPVRHNHTHELVKSLITMGIWRPRHTEQDYWTLTALPSTNKTRLRERLSTLNVSNVEVAYHWHAPVDGEDVGGAVFVSTSELGRSATSRICKAFPVELGRSAHRYMGVDEAAIYCPDLTVFRDLFADSDVSRALRLGWRRSVTHPTEMGGR